MHEISKISYYTDDQMLLTLALLSLAIYSYYVATVIILVI